MVTAEVRAEIKALTRRLADGDRRAIRPAFEALWPIVQRFSARALPAASDADDAAQEALTKFFEQVADFDTNGDAVGWVLTIAAYECRTMRRKVLRRREERGGDATETLTGDSTPEKLLIEQDLEAAARELLGTLREEDIRTIVAAIAETKGAEAKGTAFRKRLQRAFERLRVAWRTKHGT